MTYFINTKCVLVKHST